MFVNGYCSYAGHLLQHNGDLTEVGRTRPERTMSGVVRGLTESSVPGWRVS